MRQARLWDIPRLSWLSAHAYTGRRTVWNFLLCAVAYPLHVFSLVPFILSGETHTTNNTDAMVIIYRSGAGLRAWLRWVTYTVELTGFLAVSAVLANVSPFFIMVIFVLVLVNAAVVLAQNFYTIPAIFDMFLTAPKKRHWIMSGLAQHPKSRFIGLQLAQEVVRTIAPGAILLLTARSSKHARIYERYGFTPTRSGSLTMTKTL